MENSNNAVIIILIAVICILIGLGGGYYLFGNHDKKVENPVTTTTTTAVIKTTTLPKELENAVVKEFKDIETGDIYYLATWTMESNGDLYYSTKNAIYDSYYKEITLIPELSTSHIWLKSGDAILSNDKSVTSALMENKVYSLAVDENQCDLFIEYETYIQNGRVVQNKIKTFTYNDVDVSGEKC